MPKLDRRRTHCKRASHSRKSYKAKKERVEILRDPVSSDESQTEKESNQDPDFTSNKPKERIQTSDKLHYFL